MRLPPTLLLVFALIACDAPKLRRSSSSLLQDYGLQESFRYRSTIELAVKLADGILGSGSFVRLHPAWRGEGAGMRLSSVSDGSFTLSLAVPVYAVDGDQLPERHIVFVPPGERCIIINTDRLPDLFRMFSREKGDNGFSIDEPAALAFVLLHEAGHLHYGDASSFVESNSSSARDILAMELSLENIKAGQAKNLNRELRADVFAMDCIQSAQKSQNVELFSSSSDVLMLIANTDWNLGMNRFSKHIWFRSNARRALFRDTSYTHPNLELRLKIILYLAYPLKEIEEGLRSFLEERDQSPESGVLFRMEKSPREPSLLPLGSLITP